MEMGWQKPCSGIDMPRSPYWPRARCTVAALSHRASASARGRAPREGLPRDMAESFDFIFVFASFLVFNPHFLPRMMLSGGAFTRQRVTSFNSSFCCLLFFAILTKKKRNRRCASSYGIPPFLSKLVVGKTAEDKKTREEARRDQNTRKNGSNNNKIISRIFHKSTPSPRKLESQQTKRTPLAARLF